MNLLVTDVVAVVRQITDALRKQVLGTLHRRGVIVAMSGGVDSSVCAALAARAFGPERVFALFLPEHDSDPQSLALASNWARELGIAHATVDIAPILAACGCYAARDNAIRRLVPEYGAGWRCKLVLPGNRLDSDRLNVFELAVQPPGGEIRKLRLPPVEYREIVAATNFKQRVRKMLEYFHADRLHYAVVGTPNRLEYDQGFFVKGGDGLADVKPIAHLHKTQVYQLAEFLRVPAEITERAPTTDTYSLPQSQQEFYFLLPTELMDIVLAGHNAGLRAEELAAQVALEPVQIQRVYKEIEQKRATTRYLHMPALLVESVPEVTTDADPA